MSRKVNWKAFLHKQKTFGKHFSKRDMVTLWHILPLKADPLSGTCGNYQVCWKGPRAGRKICVVNGGGSESSAWAGQTPCWNTLYQSFSSGPHLTHPKLESTYARSPMFSSSPNNTQATLESSLIPSSLSSTTATFLRVHSRQSLS